MWIFDAVLSMKFGGGWTRASEVVRRGIYNPREYYNPQQLFTAIIFKVRWLRSKICWLL